MRRYGLIVLLAGACSSNDTGTAGKAGKAGGKAPASDAAVAKAAPADARPPEPPRIIAPSAEQLMKKPNLRDVRRRKWWAFAGTYFRVWGGTEVGSQPKGASITRDGKLFITNTGYPDNKNVYRLDPKTLKVLARAKFKGNAVESVPSHDGKTLFVSNFRRKEVLALDTEDLHIKKRYRVQHVPKHMAVHPDDKTLYVANWESATISIVDVQSGEAKHLKTGGRSPRGVALGRDSKTLYVTNFDSGTFTIFDMATWNRKVITDPACPFARHAAVTRDDKLVLITCYGRRYIRVLDRASGEYIKRVEVGNGPKTIDVSLDGKFAYIANYRGHGMTIIDLTTWQTLFLRMPVYKGSGMAVSPDDRFLYLTGWDSRNLIVVQRLMPGEDPGKLELGPRPPYRCHRNKNPERCTKFP